MPTALPELGASMNPVDRFPTGVRQVIPRDVQRQGASPGADQDTVRIGGLSAVPTVLRELGADPARILAGVGLNLDLFDDPDNVIAFETRDRLFAHCAARTGCAEFGFRVGQHMDASNFGLVGSLARYSPNVGSGLRSLVHFLHLHVRGAVSSLGVDGSWAEWRYGIRHPRLHAADQLGDGAIATMFNIMRGLCHPAWKPALVLLAHRRPEDIRPYCNFFQAPMEFDADRYALVFTADWLDRALPGNDPELRRLLQKQIDALQGKYPDNFPDQVRSVLRTAILTGHSNSDQVSALLSMHRRTLCRRLAESGATFHQLVDECRLEMVRQMLKSSDMEVVQIAAALGYSDASALTRAFRRWTGTTPARWRRTGGS
jgi:AraC-like DNA-binding protein